MVCFPLKCNGTGNPWPSVTESFRGAKLVSSRSNYGPIKDIAVCEHITLVTKLMLRTYNLGTAFRSSGYRIVSEVICVISFSFR